VAVLWKPALLLAGLVVAGLALRSGVGREALDAPAQLGPVGFVAVAAIACALGVPRQVAAYAAGLGFGLWTGTALALVAQILGCAADFIWARAVARDWAARRMRGRLARLDAALAKHPFSATFTLRLLPIGSNVVLNLLAGVSGVAVAPFLLASLLGYVPQTVVFVLLGAGVSVGHGTQIALAVALFAVASAVGLWLLRRRGSSAPT
jgi:uncharacterized membrane protein YdjX (TVP38/TMEM64 family)